MSVEKIDTPVKQETVRESLEAAMAEIEEGDVTDDLPDDPKPNRDGTGKFAAKDVSLPDDGEIETPAEPETGPVKEPVPQSWTPEAKAEWEKVPAHVRAEITRREQEIHKAYTAPDGELRIGREMKEVVIPYMTTINSLGVTAPVAVQHLLNTDHKLRYGTPEQKMEVVQAIFNDYKIDPSFLSRPQQAQQNNPLQPLLDKISQLEQRSDPTFIKTQLQEQMEHDNVVKEWTAFAANPKLIHLEAVKPAMAALLGSGQAKSYQEAYDSACWANPQIRSTLSAQQNAELAAKRKAENATRKQASVSVSGSPGLSAPNSTASQKTLREELSEQFDALTSSKIL